MQVLAAATSVFSELAGAAGVFFGRLAASKFASAPTGKSNEKKHAELAPTAIAGAMALCWKRVTAPVVGADAGWICARLKIRSTRAPLFLAHGPQSHTNNLHD